MSQVAIMEAEPCAICSTTGGSINRSSDRPSRFGGKPFGIEGVLCNSCYATERAAVLSAAIDAAAQLPSAIRERCRRQALVKAAKRAAFAHHCVANLTTEELDLLFAHPEDWPVRLMKLWTGTSTLPCVKCGDPKGRPGTGCTRPGRVSGSRIGIDGDVCLSCYDTLNTRQRRAKSQREVTVDA